MTKELLTVKQQRKQLFVQRCSLVRHHSDYSLAKHGFSVLSIVLDLSEILGIPLTQEDITLILRHDCFEVVTSDVPYHIKNFSDSIHKHWEAIEQELSNTEENRPYVRYTDEETKSSLSEGVFAIFKLADILDLLFFSLEEQELGNSVPELITMRDTCVDIVRDLLMPLGADAIDRSFGYIKSAGYVFLEEQF